MSLPYASRVALVVTVLAATSLLATCHLVTDFDPKRIETTEQKVYVYPEKSQVQGFDVLFVVDTRSVALLESLRQHVIEWVTTVAVGQGFLVGDRVGGANDAGGGPTGPTGDPTQPEPGMLMEYPIHVGFISSDLGLGPGGEALTDVEDAGCRGNGYGGRLLHPALATTGSGGYVYPFLVIQWGQVVSVRDATGNYTVLPVDQAVDDFWSAVESHLSLCEFQQPLGALRAALLDDNLDNLGFLRPKAGLGVVILSAGDDCSVIDSGFFVDGQGYPRQASPFECFKYGVTCNEADLSSPGVKTGCVDLAAPGEGSCWVDPYPPEEPGGPGSDYSPAACFSPAKSYAEELAGWMDPYPVAAAVLSGLISHVEVTGTASDPALAPSEQCVGTAVYPGIRLRSFVQSLGIGLWTSLCDPSASDPLSQVTNELQNRAVVRCISDPLVDTNPSTTHLDADCTVEHLTISSTGAESVVATVPSCDSGGTSEVGDCWSIRQDEKDCPGGVSLFIDTQYDEWSDSTQRWNAARATCTTVKR